MERLSALLGLGVFIGLAYVISTDRRSVRWQPVLWGFALQLLFALLILRTTPGFAIFEWLGLMVSKFLDFSDAGAAFVFGENFQDFFFAFKVLPTIVFFSAVISVLYHYGLLQWLVGAIARIMVRTMKTSGSETLSAAGNIFVGQTEAPLLIKPYIETMTMSELHAVMTGGFATVAGGVLAAYVSFGIPAEHLIAASVMSAPAALAMSKIMFPETEDSPTKGEVKLTVEKVNANGIDAIATGALDGLRLALNVGAVIIAFLGVLAAVNALIGWLGMLAGMEALSLESILAVLLSPVAWLMGVPWADCNEVGTLLGKKTILNEFIAYLDLQALSETKALSERAVIIATYALCGFANIGSIGIQIGGIGGIAPSRQSDLARIGFRAMIAGTLACFTTACIAGLLL
ncbi:MAG: NupC/NupG family nucleoside CNT transporter [Cyanobacteria bacterium J06581_3]